MKYKYLLLLLLMLPFVSGCNDSDDVNGIFTGKVWKLTYITKKNEHKPYDFWGDKDKYEQSIKNYINKEGAYTIKFEGETTDNVISGKFSGTLLPPPGIPARMIPTMKWILYPSGSSARPIKRHPDVPIISSPTRYAYATHH